MSYGVAPPNFDDWRRQNRVFEGMAAILERRFNLTGGELTGGETPETLQGAQVTPEFFRVLGVRPALGRDFLPEEGRPRRPSSCCLHLGLRRQGSSRTDITNLRDKAGHRRPV